MLVIVCLVVINAADISWAAPQSNSESVASSDTDSGSESQPDVLQVRKTFKDVFADREFDRLQRILKPDSTEKSWLEEVLDSWFGGTSETSSNKSSDWSFLSLLGQLLYWLAWALAVTALSFVGWILVRSVLRHLEDKANFEKADSPGVPEDALELSHPPGEYPADEYERRAVGLAKSGNYKSAIRELVLGSMSWIERAGLIRYRKGLTNRDYIRAVWRKKVERASLEHIVLDFERAYFGRRVPDATSFELCLENYQRAFAREDVLVES
ncbi:DUF4129 domain-containing protein [bacterium]|nr:DUF4129 domain-containing protein [bacterium]